MVVKWGRGEGWRFLFAGRDFDVVTRRNEVTRTQGREVGHVIDARPPLPAGCSFGYLLTQYELNPSLSNQPLAGCCSLGRKVACLRVWVQCWAVWRCKLGDSLLLLTTTSMAMSTTTSTSTFRLHPPRLDSGSDSDSDRGADSLVADKEGYLHRLLFDWIAVGFLGHSLAKTLAEHPCLGSMFVGGDEAGMLTWDSAWARFFQPRLVALFDPSFSRSLGICCLVGDFGRGWF